MFYSQLVLSKRGPLAKLWLAAHWEKKLTKAQICETSIDQAVQSIVTPKMKLALRTTGHLLLGVVRIYSRKTKYLLADCNEALIKIKMAFRPGASVDLPEDSREAALNAITLPEVFHDFDSALPDFNEMDYEQQLAMNQSRIDEITLKEDVPTQATFSLDDEFGSDGEFASTEFNKGNELNIFETERSSDGNLDLLGTTTKRGTARNAGIMDTDEPMLDDFGAPMDTDGFGIESGINLFGGDDVNMEEDFTENLGGDEKQSPGAVFANKQASTSKKEASTLDSASDITETTVVQNDDGFALGSLDTVTQQEKHRGRRKRRLIIDDMKAITGDDMKLQLTDFTDTLTTLDLAPPTKKVMHLKETGGVDRLLQSPGIEITSKSLLRLFATNLTNRQRVDEGECSKVGLVLDDLESIRGARAGSETPQRVFSPVADDSLVGSIQNSRRDSIDLQLPPISEESGKRGEHGPPSVSPLANRSFSPGIPTALDDDLEQSDKRKIDYSRPPPSPRKERRNRASQQQVHREVLDNDSDNDEDDDDDDTEPTADDGPRWNKRTHQILNTVRTHFKTTDDDELAFSDLVSGHDTRKSAAQKFYALLVLKKWRAIGVAQDEPYGDITITPGPEMNTVQT